MTSRRRSNRLILQEVIEESRKEAEEAVAKPAPKLQSHGDGPIDAAAKDPEGHGGGSGNKRKDSEESSARGKGRKRLRKLTGVTNNNSKRVSTGNHSEGDGSAGSDSDGGVAVLSDRMGDPDCGVDDDGDGDALLESTRKIPGRNLRGAVRNSNKRKPLSIHNADSEDVSEVNDDSDPDDDTVDRERSQKTTAITSKSSSSAPIPTRAIPRRKQESSTSSLLTHMEKPVPSALDPHLPQGLSRLPTSSKNKASSTSTATRPPIKTPLDPSPTIAVLPPNQRLSPKRDESQANDAATFAARYVPSSHSSQLSALASFPKQKIMTDLEWLCDKIGEDIRFALPPSASIDLSGSFLSEDDRYDFFDTNDAGEIVFQPKVPIFPEEFPPGMTEHSLSWWGILDPDLGDGKFRDPVASAPVDHANRSAPAYRSVHPGGGHFQQPQWSQLPPSQPTQLAEPPTSSLPPHYAHRGPSSWTPPRQGSARNTSGGPPPNWAPQSSRPEYRGPAPPAPPGNRRYSPPRHYDRR